jgi:hypothetical protein
MSTPLGTVRKSLYDTDFVDWAARTADLLRRGRLDELDLKNVAEEIEDLGKSERSAVRSQLRRMLVHVVKSRIQPERSGAIWRGSVASARTEILDHFGDSPSLRKHTEINLQRIHREAVELALVETNVAAHEANPHIPEECPYTPGDPARRRLPDGLPVLRGRFHHRFLYPLFSQPVSQQTQGARARAELPPLKPELAHFGCVRDHYRQHLLVYVDARYLV